MLALGVRMYLLGYSFHVIAARTGISHPTVRKELDRLGVPLRPRGQEGRKRAELLRQTLKEAAEYKKSSGVVPDSVLRPPALRRLDFDELRRRYENGERTSDLAEEFGFESRKAMEQLLRAANTEMRRRGPVPGWTSPKHRNVVKTHCPQGHEYTPENTRHYVYKNGRKNRFCRACNIAAVKRNRDRKKAEEQQKQQDDQ